MLQNFVTEKLNHSEETMQILQMEINEARFALKPWPVETLIVKKLDKNTCTCNEGMTSQERDEEIGKMLLYSQQLREKLIANVQRERQGNRKSTIQQIYGTKVTTNNDKIEQQRSRSVSRVLPIKEEKKRSLSIDRKQQTNRFKTGTKNFILANKLSVAASNSMKKIDDKKPTLLRNRSKSVLITPPIDNSKNDNESEMDLYRLLKKYTDESNVDATSLRDNCPLHQENAKSVIEEKIITHVDAAEGLDRYGVPSNLVNILKSCHGFLKNQILNENQSEKQSEDAANRFIDNFEKANKKKEIQYSIPYPDLLSGYSKLYKESFITNDSSNTCVKNLIFKYKTLDLLFKNIDVKDKHSSTKFHQSYANELYKNNFVFGYENWLSNGVWNFACVEALKDLFGNFCILYHDQSQLLQFYDLIQNAQRKIYETDLIDIITTLVIPLLKKNYSPKSIEFIEIYKLIVAVIQVTNIKVPALAETE